MSLLDWAHVTKLPLKDDSGRVIGVMGVLRPPDVRERQFPAFAVLSQAVVRLRRDFGGRLTIEALATECGLSLRALLSGKFRRVFSFSHPAGVPHEDPSSRGLPAVANDGPAPERHCRRMRIQRPEFVYAAFQAAARR